ncbi:hypothetical protein EV192_101177 [Actinocrispum wychmicini]|uniref:Uncharacterized protein n=1 Tax=Actinocrispum wychmicini TaxID=1213861 RepID=A0A4R2K3Q4_9PSEU|nr:hypothetical protein EV192_101177 [Actinocrispum wychmicini]
MGADNPHDEVQPQAAKPYSNKGEKFADLRQDTAVFRNSGG